MQGRSSKRLQLYFLVFQLPPARQQRLHMGLRVAVVDQIQHACIMLRADHAARGLHHLAHAWVEIAVVMPQPLAKALLQALAQGFVDRVELRQPQRGDKSPHQT